MLRTHALNNNFTRDSPKGGKKVKNVIDFISENRYVILGVIGTISVIVLAILALQGA
jgi:hypothetical protein